MEYWIIVEMRHGWDVQQTSEENGKTKEIYFKKFKFLLGFAQWVYKIFDEDDDEDIVISVYFWVYDHSWL